MPQLSFEKLQILSTSARSKPAPGGYLLTDKNPSLTFERKVQYYYRHGWQSWSLTTWQTPEAPLPVQKPELLHAMQSDPLYVKHPAPNGSWVGAVEFEEGNILLLGALELEAHVALHGLSRGEVPQLHGWYESGGRDWYVGYGQEEEVFAHYTGLLAERFGRNPNKPTPRVWCSWYSLYTAIEESLLLRVFEEVGELPFDVLQVDDGWQKGIGDWEANEKFPAGMEALAGKIRATNRTPGLWLAPLLVVPSSNIYRKHPEWLLRDEGGKPVSAGYNWGEPLHALDTTHPEALGWLAELMKTVRTWGFDYLKLDFLYAGALPGIRYHDTPRESAYRQGLQVMREAMGDDAYLLACGAPILPSLGLCDALRIGPDVAEVWESRRDATLLYNPTTPGVKNAIRTTVNRLWLRPLVATDPDVAYFRSLHASLSKEQKRLLQDLALVCNFKATSDPPQWLSREECRALNSFLEAEQEITRKGRHSFTLDDRTVDFSPAMPMPPHPRGMEVLGSALVGWLGNRPWALKIVNKLNALKLKKYRDSLF